MDLLAVNILSFVSETIVAVIVVVLILQYYLSFSKTSKVVYFFTALGYFFSVAILFLMPVDLGVTNYVSCKKDYEIKHNETAPEEACINIKPFNFIDPEILTIMWGVIYWTTYACTWLVYPVLQSYVVSGEFGFKNKLKTAIKQNLIFYAASAVFLIIIFVILCIIMKGLARAWDVAQIAGNLWGLFVLIALLGYGLVYIPKTLFRRANRKLELKNRLFNLCGYADDIEIYRVALDDTMKLIKQYEIEVKKDDEAWNYVQEIMKHVPPEYSLLKNGFGEVKSEHDDFVVLHRKLIQDCHNYNTAKCLFEETYKQAIYLEDTIKDRAEGCTKWPERRSPGFFGLAKDFTVWLWTIISPTVFRLTALITAIMSLALVLSEVAFPFEQVSFLSPYAFVLNLFTDYPLFLQTCIFALISYSGACCYTALFKLKLFNYYKLLPHQMTDSYSILFSAAYLSRLVAPLSLNFIHVTNFSSKSFPSPFLNTMQSDPIQSTAYLYFPIILVIFCFVNVFNLGNKLMGLCKFRTFQYSDDYDDEQIARGRDVLERERIARERGSTLVRGLCQEVTVPNPKLSPKEGERDEVQIKLDLEDSIDRDDESQVEIQQEPSVGEKFVSFFKSFIPKDKDDSKTELLNASNSSQELSEVESDTPMGLHDKLKKKEQNRPSFVSKEPKSKSKTKSKSKSKSKKSKKNEDEDEDSFLHQSRKKFDFN